MSSDGAKAELDSSHDHALAELSRKLKDGHFNPSLLPCMSRMINTIKKMKLELSPREFPALNVRTRLEDMIRDTIRVLEHFLAQVHAETNRIADLVKSTPALPLNVLGKYDGNDDSDLGEGNESNFKDVGTCGHIDYIYVMAVERWVDLLAYIPTAREEEEQLIECFARFYNAAIFEPFRGTGRPNNHLWILLQDLTAIHDILQRLRCSYKELNEYVTQLHKDVRAGVDKLHQAPTETRKIIREWKQTLMRVDQQKRDDDVSVLRQLARASKRDGFAHPLRPDEEEVWPMQKTVSAPSANARAPGISEGPYLRSVRRKHEQVHPAWRKRTV